MTKYFANASGLYLGAFDGAEPPAGSIEVPAAPSDARQTWTGGAWVLPAEHVAAQEYAAYKASRDAQVAAIIVTTASGKVFDGNEPSQDRMTRAVAGGDPAETTLWRMADNTVATVTREELREALRLAGQAQTAIWMAP